MGEPISGFNGVIELGGTPETMGELRSWEYTREGEEEDTTVMGTARVSIINIKVQGRLTFYCNNWPGTVPAQDAGQALLQVDDVVACKLYPNGIGSGKPQLAANIRIKTEGGSANATGYAEGEVAFEIDGATDWTRTAQA